MTLYVACERFTAESEITCDCDALSTSEMNDLIDQASDALAIMSNGAVTGRCTDTVRPRGPGGCTCRCTSIVTCGCNPVEGVTLRGPNPDEITVKIDGVAFTDYKLIDGTTLIRSDGQNWPGCQDLSLDADAVGTFEITYTYGMEVPLLAKQAAEEIVCSMIKTPPQQARKSHPNVTSMSIAGVNIQLEQMVAEIERRTFLMPAVIRFFAVYAPDQSPAVVYAPELEGGWRLHTVT